MTTPLEKLKQGIDKYQKPQGNPVDQVKTTGKTIVKANKLVTDIVQEKADKLAGKAEETYKGMKDLGGKLLTKGKKMFNGTDVSDGLKKY